MRRMRGAVVAAAICSVENARIVVEVHGNHEEEKRFIEDYLRPFGFRVVESDRSLLYLERG